MALEGDRHHKLCFVTIGATAAFDALINAVLSLDVLQALSHAGFAKILVQYGKDGKSLFESLISSQPHTQDLGLAFEGFDFDSDGLTEQMVAARQSEGVVISHAGKACTLH